MNGFFERYGRMIIVAVVICFVLLYLTPMRNVVGSSINDFAGNFANKVGDSIGAMKLPNGSANIVKEKSSMLITGEEFDNKIPSEATTVIFTDEKAPKGTSTTDLTVTKDGDVVGWLDGTTWKVSTQDYKKTVTFNKNSSKMFNGNNDLTTISFDNIDTSNVTNMIGMFGHCSSLTSLNLSNFDTSKVTDMSEMFLSCYDLTSLDITRFNTTNVTNMGNMFYGCRNLQEVDLSDLDTSNVTDMEGMFGCCSNLQTIKVRSQTDIDKLKANNTKVNSSVKFEIA